jgi:nicotinate-nucleotide adenylyltransferase
LTGRAGLFGGMFNPPHNGHIRVALAALTQYGLKEVVFVPAGAPSLKPEPVEASGEDRFEMVAAAVATTARLSVSRIEIDREGRSYTIDTVRELKDDYPEGICLILGADCLQQIHRWKESDALLRSVPLIVAPRASVSLSGFDGEDVAVVYPLDMPEVCVSSSEIRELVRQRRAIGALVPSEVAKYIETHGLYQDRDRAVNERAAENRRPG